MNYRAFAIAAGIITPDDPNPVESYVELAKLAARANGCELTPDELAEAEEYGKKLDIVAPKIESIYPFVLPSDQSGLLTQVRTNSDGSVTLKKFRNDELVAGYSMGRQMTDEESTTYYQVMQEIQEKLGR
jgi:hypothetical protein